jgi:4-carboxymuconolactone decarboxylase
MNAPGSRVDRTRLNPQTPSLVVARELLNDCGIEGFAPEQGTPSCSYEERQTAIEVCLKPRIAPVSKSDWTPAQRALLQPLEKSGWDFNVFSTFAVHASLYRDWLSFATLVMRRNSLPDRDRELLVLRMAWITQSEYEWAQHTRIGRTVGLTDDDFNRIIAGPDHSEWESHERLLLQATDELKKDTCVSDATWNGLLMSYSIQQMMDLVFTVGQHNLVAMALKSFRVQLDEGFEGFPPQSGEPPPTVERQE